MSLAVRETAQNLCCCWLGPRGMRRDGASGEIRSNWIQLYSCSRLDRRRRALETSNYGSGAVRGLKQRAGLSSDRERPWGHCATRIDTRYIYMTARARQSGPTHAAAPSINSQLISARRAFAWRLATSRLENEVTVVSRKLQNSVTARSRKYTSCEMTTTAPPNSPATHCREGLSKRRARSPEGGVECCSLNPGTNSGWWRAGMSHRGDAHE